MMLRGLVLLAGVLAAATIASPLPASANWKDEHSSIPSGTNPELSLDGWGGFTGGVGSISCPQTVLASIQLTGGTTDAHLKSFTSNAPQIQCTVGGLIGAICGQNSLTTVQLDGAGTVVPSKAGPDISITKLDLTFTFGQCLEITLRNTGSEITEVPLTAVVVSGTTQTINEITLLGDLYESGFEETVEVHYGFRVTPEGRYGFE